MSYQFENQNADKAFMDDMDPEMGGRRDRDHEENQNPGVEKDAKNSDYSYRTVEPDRRLAVGFEDSRKNSRTINYNGYNGTEGYTVKKGVVKEDASIPSMNELVDIDPTGEKGQQVGAMIPLEEAIDGVQVMPDSIFIDEQPSVNDVLQNNVGDCFFLTALLQILSSDPNYIKSVIASESGTVHTKFFYKDKKKWEQTEYTVNWGVVEQTKKGEDPELKGSRFRVKKEPGKVFWNAEISPVNFPEGKINSLKFNKKSYYQAALWVNCMEQAYSKFAQEHGIYGTGADSADRKTARYDLLDQGGVSGPVMNIFYGENNSTSVVSYKDNRSGDIADAANADNAEIISALVDYAKDQNSGEAQTTFIGVGRSKQATGKFIQTYITKTIDEVKAAKTIPQGLDKDRVLTLLDQLNKSSGGSKYANMDVDKYENALFSLYAMKDIDSHMDAMGAKSWSLLKAVSSSLIDDLYIGGSNMTRFVQGGHSHNLVKVNFINKDTKKSFIPTEKEYAQIDNYLSTVTLQNPHGQDRPFFGGREEELTDQYNGEFTISLAQYFLTTSQMSISKLTK